MMKNNLEFDFIVLGGGIAGLGFAESLTKNGYKVLLLEKADLAQGTSNNSLRIIHGGFRYLQNFDFARVIESIRAQRDILKNFSGSVRELRCLMPLKPWGLKSKIPVFFACLLYKLIARLLGAKYVKAGVFCARKAQEITKLFDYSHGALCWTDILLSDPAGLVSSVSKNIQDQGGIIKTNCLVKIVKKLSSGFLVQYLNNGITGDVYSKHIIDTLGYKSLDVEKDGINLALDSQQLRQGWCKGLNLVVTKQFHPKYAFAFESHTKGQKPRMFFAVPRGDNNAIGTAYFEQEVDGERFLQDINEALHDRVVIEPHQVAAIDVGVLPASLEDPLVPLGRSKIYEDDGYFYFLGTKYTTFQTQADKFVKEFGFERK